MSPNALAASRLFEVAGDILTFLGGLILSWEALNKASILEEDRAFIELVKKLNGLSLIDEHGHPLTTPQDVEFRAMRRTIRLAQAGVVVVTAGFLLQLISRFL